MSTPTSATGSGGSGGRFKDQKIVGVTGHGVDSSTASYSAKSPQSPENNVLPSTSRLFTVSVVGLSGAEKEKGSCGVGKSCLCNRFVRPLEDEYRTDHISTLSQVDFGGRVVNNDHWLYWGERSLIVDDGAEINFRLIEQTEFVDDESFQTLKGSSGQRDPYAKRCASVRLQSADKLMYICKDQLGLESEYDQKSLPDGKSVVDGFICVYDISYVPNRSMERQTEFVVQILQNILKTKKPVVFVTTKNDEFDEKCVKEAEKLISRREFKNLVPVVESSSNQNVNVESGFVLLAHLIEKIRAKPKILNFNDALKSRREIVDVATTAFGQKLRSAVQDHRVSWTQVSKQLSYDSDFQHFIELCGRSRAQKYYRQHQRELRERYLQRKLQKQVGKLPEILPHLVPDIGVLRGKTWDEVLQILPTLPQFTRLFQPVGTLAASLDQPYEATSSTMTNVEDFRLSAEILYTPEAEEYFRNHVNSLETDYRRKKLQDEFLQLLTGCSQVTPGKPLSDLRIFFIGKECFESLSETDLQTIYDNYQRQLIRKSRRDFVELLQEQVEEFVSRVLFRSKKSSPNAYTVGGGSGSDKSRYLPGLTDVDMRELHAKLQEDVRYRQLNRLHQARDNMICQYVGFLSYPLKQHCPAEPRCVDNLVENLLENKLHRNVVWNDSAIVGANNVLNLIFFGVDGLPNQLIRETQVFMNDDEFSLEGVNYIFNYRCIDGDLNLPHNFLCSPNFQPHGLVCVFSSRSSLDFVRESFSRHLLALLRPEFVVDSKNSGLAGVPVVFLLACDPSHLEDLPYLQQQGARMAENFRCAFVGLEPSTSHLTADRRARSAGGFFTEDQIQRVLTWMVSSTSTASTIAEPKNNIVATSPLTGFDVKLLICFMCGDDFSPELVLTPFLNYQRRSTSASSPSNGNHHENGGESNSSNVFNGRQPFENDERRRTFVIETFLPTLSRKFTAEITVVAYHTGIVWLAEHVFHHGYILVYSAKRRASLANLYSFAHLIPDLIPLLVIAVGEVAEFFSDPATNVLITEGNDIADRIRARFITVSKAGEQQISVFAPFLADVWSKKCAIEQSGLINMNSPKKDSYVDDERRPDELFHWSENSAIPSPYQRQISKHHLNDVDETASHYAHLSQFASGWPLKTSPDVGKKSSSAIVADSIQRTPPQISYNRTLSSQSRPSSSDMYRESNDSMSRSYISQDPSPSSFNSCYVNDVASTKNTSQSTSVYAGGGTKRQMSNCNLSMYEQSPSTSSNSNLAVLNSGEFARQRRMADGNGKNDAGTKIDRNRPDAAPRRTNRGSLVHLHRQATSEIEIYYGGSPDCPRPQNSFANSLRRTLFGWWETGSEGALAKSGYNSSSQANTPLGGGSPMSVRDLNGKKSSSTKFYAKDDSIGARSDRIHFGDRLPPANQPPSMRTIGLPLAMASAAPLATPENIEVGVDYMTVKDALSSDARDFIEDEEQYATVASVLPRDEPKQRPTKKTEIQFPVDSSSGESLEKVNAYEKSGRKPTPHRRDKKKSNVGPTIAERVRQLNAASAVAPGSPPSNAVAFSRERLFKSGGASQISVFPILRSSASEESLLDHHREPKRRQNNFSMRQKILSPSSSPSLIRRMASSFRFRRGDKMDVEESKSVPQSPVFSERVFVLPPFQGGVAIEQPSDSSGSSIWLNPSSKISSGSSSISPKRIPNDKMKNERKISRDIVKKYSGELPAKLLSANKKRSSKESSQTQLVPPEATLKDLSPSEADPIPKFVRKCVDFIEAEGLTMEGIYRVPGNQAHVMLLEQRFAEDPNISFHSMDIPVNAVATALKNFFAYLNEPLLPYCMYEDLMAAMSSKTFDEKLSRAKEVLTRLQHENRAVLRYFITHLRKVAHHAHMTAMDHRNLAKCWWPTLLRPQFDSFETMAQMTQRLEEFVQILLDNPSII